MITQNVGFYGNGTYKPDKRVRGVPNPAPFYAGHYRRFYQHLGLTSISSKKWDFHVTRVYV